MILKLFTSFLVVMIFHLGYSQTIVPADQTTFFAQCMIDLDSPQQAEELALNLRENPYVKIVRVDWPTKRVFLITENIVEFTIDSFISWLGEFSLLSSCIQVGLHGVDQVNPYPFVNCNN